MIITDFLFADKIFLVSRNRSSSRLVGGFCSTESDDLRKTEENHQEDCLPFFLDDDSSGAEGSPSFSRKKSSMKSTYGFDLNTKLDKVESASHTSNNVNYTSKYGSVAQRPENTTKRLDNHKISRRNLTDPLESPEQRFASPHSKGINYQNEFSFFHFCFLWLDL